jgi:ATP-binding protein involved in chromosome partitioning
MLEYTQMTVLENLRHIRFVLGIVAGKGGVGKSTVAVNLARAWADQGLKIGLLDADIYGPSLRQMLPEESLPLPHPSLEGQIIPAMSNGIKVISMAFFRDSQEALAVRAPFANGVIGQFLHKVVWGELDILLIDFPPGTGDIHLTISQESRMHGVVVVTTPQEIALMDVRKAIHMCHQIAAPVLGILENMSYWCDPNTNQRMHLLGEGGGKSLSKETGIPLLGEIPIEPLLTQAGDKGENLLHTTPNCPASLVFKHASQALLQQLQGLEAMEGQYVKTFELVWQ